MPIKLLVTGGTLDKRYNHLNGELRFEQSHIGEMIQQGRVTAETSIDWLMLKDSLEMTDSDRAQIVQACQSCIEDKIVITHGTDTMVETAKAIAQSVQDKAVVIFGAMIPYELKRSDALFNFGCAMSAVQILPPGVYITMNGKVFNYDQVVKNTCIGEFEKAR